MDYITTQFGNQLGNNVIRSSLTDIIRKQDFVVLALFISISQLFQMITDYCLSMRAEYENAKQFVLQYSQCTKTKDDGDDQGPHTPETRVLYTLLQKTPELFTSQQKETLQSYITSQRSSAPDISMLSKDIEHVRFYMRWELAFRIICDTTVAVSGVLTGLTIFVVSLFLQNRMSENDVDTDISVFAVLFVLMIMLHSYWKNKSRMNTNIENKYKFVRKQHLASFSHRVCD